ncbi:MAG: glycosyltransferase, partial [Sedimentisphaerales bacterium]|nr:glycosyltransferase [Sedimentisphaerales bacterium]
MDLSIIIPVLNESHKIAVDIRSAADFFARNELTGEIIIVDDGSTDGTAQTARETADNLSSNVPVKVIRSEKNRGKGFAVKQGVKESCGRYVAFVDCGCCVPYDYLLKGIEMIKNERSGIDIAHASRKLNESTIIEHQNLYRRTCSLMFKWLLVKVMKACGDFTDTQCGFKVYRGEIARQLYNMSVTDGFMFDIEIILRAQKKGFRIGEFPIEWTCDPDSRLS